MEITMEAEALQTEIAPTTPPIEDTTALVTAAKQAKVTDADSFLRVFSLLQGVRGAIQSHTKRREDKINEKKKELATLQKELADALEPWEKLDDLLTKMLIAFDDESERQKTKRELQLRAKELKEAEDSAVELATLAEQAGDLELALQILNSPQQIIPIVVEKETPKFDGHFSKRHHYEVTDFKTMLEGWKEEKIPIQAFTFDKGFLNKQATAMKEALQYPGVKVVAKKTLNMKKE